MRALLAILLLLPFAHGLEWTDQVGDHEMGVRTHYQDGEAQETWTDAGEMYPYVDVLEGSIDETPENLIVKVQVADTEPSGNEPVKMDRMDYRFTYELSERQEAMGFTVRDGEPMFQRWVKATFFGEVYWFVQSQFEATLLSDGDGWVASVPKEFFLDVNGVPLRKGAELKNLEFRAEPGRGSGIEYTCPDVSTNMDYERCSWMTRDLITDMGSYTVQLNPPGVDHLFAQIDAPYRVSNGLATTYTYELTLINSGDESDVVDFIGGNTPHGWDLYLPPATPLAAGESTTLSLAMSVPFTHQHGRVESANFRVQSTLSPNTEITKHIFISFPDPAQPGGHHPEVYFHGAGRDLWMNTLIQDPEGPDERVEPQFNSLKDLTHPFYGWTAYLNPILGLGLDFKTGEDVALTFSVDPGNSLPVETPTVVTANLYLLQWNDDTLRRVPLASYEGEHTLPASGPTTLELPLATMVDRVPYAPSRNMQLDVNFTYDATQTPQQTNKFNDNQPAFLVESSKMVLPLVDYHDEVNWDGLVAQSLSLTNRTDAFRALNAGNTTAVIFDVANKLSKTQTVTWELEGANSDWASVTPKTSIIAGNSNASVVVRMTPPADANDGEAVDVLLMGTGDVQPITKVFARVAGLVTSEVNVPDESQDVEELEREAERSNATKDSPLGIVVAILALALVLRRK